MEDFGKLRTRWDQCLANYIAEKSDVDARIVSICASMKEKGSPPPDGFLARVKSRVGRGVADLKSHKQIWDLERRLASSKENVSAEAARTRDQLLDIALALDVNANAKAELARLPASSQALDGLRQTAAAVIQDLEKAARAQDEANWVKTFPSALQAKEATDRASRSFDSLAIRLMQPPSGLGSGEWSSLGPGEFATTNWHTFAFNMAGKGAWMNFEMAHSLRRAISKLQALDRSIGVALKSITDRRTSLVRNVMTAACSADADFNTMHEAIGRWL